MLLEHTAMPGVSFIVKLVEVPESLTALLRMLFGEMILVPNEIGDRTKKQVAGTRGFRNSE